jgi:hypothetical protein
MIRVSRTARSTGGFRWYREDYTQIVGGTLDDQRRKICVREHELPSFLDLADNCLKSSQPQA